MKKSFKRISLCLFFLAIVNFTLLWSIGLFLGGSALNGKTEDGRYYLGNHGDLTEVSESTWNYCYYHEVSAMITHPLGLGSMALAHKLERQQQARTRVNSE